ncbi:MAG: nucleotidyltransferase domain-containing protein [Chthoniobacteraceae bacterium]
MRLASFCARRGVQRLEVFGSVVSGRARQNNDVDLLVTLRVEPPVEVSELLDMAGEAEEIIGKPVDFVLRRDVERAASARSRQILKTAVCIYGN